MELTSVRGILVNLLSLSQSEPFWRRRQVHWQHTHSLLFYFSLRWFLSLTHLFLHSFSTGPIGAITAMHDAVALANLIYSLPSNTSEEITKAFKEYHAERYPPAVEAYNSSLMLSKLLKGGFTGAIAWFMTNNMPNWLWRISVCYMYFFLYYAMLSPMVLFYSHRRWLISSHDRVGSETREPPSAEWVLETGEG